jgi:hypothetical protein
VSDKATGTATTGSGWTFGTGDAQITALSFSLASYMIFPGDTLKKLPATLPANYPTTDFYGSTISGSGAVGAVQTAITSAAGYYYVEASVNNSAAGSVAVSGTHDDDWFYNAATFTATAESGCTFEYWLVGGVKNAEPSNVLTLATLTGPTFVKAVFSRPQDKRIGIAKGENHAKVIIGGGNGKKKREDRGNQRADARIAR